MKSFRLGILFLSICSTMVAQAPDTVWVKKYGGPDQDHGNYVLQTNDGGYIFTGETKSFGAGLNDAWLVKTDESGDTMWTRTYGGIRDENVSCLRQTSDGGYILFAESDSFHPILWKTWLIKTNSFGDTIWTSKIGENRHYFAQSGLEIGGGQFVFAGYTKETAAGQEDVWIVKTNEFGDTIWTKTFGGSEGDLTQCMDVTNDGGFIIAASSKSFSSGDYDCWLIRTDSDGDTVWTRVFGGFDDDHIYSIEKTDDNGFILAGGTQSFGHANNFYDAWLIKTDATGNAEWIKTFGFDGSDLALSVNQTSDGCYVLAGYSYLGAWIIKTNSSGDTLWTKSLGWGSAKQIQQTSDGGYIVLVGTFTTATMNDAYLVKLGPEPNDVEPKDLNGFADKFILNQNFPNPFNPSTTIRFVISDLGLVNLKVYDVLGNEVTTLVNEELPSGEYEVEFDRNYYSREGMNLSSGTYFYKIQSGKYFETKKMILIK